jgi:hypothetical protein
MKRVILGVSSLLCLSACGSKVVVGDASGGNGGSIGQAGSGQVGGAPSSGQAGNGQTAGAPGGGQPNGGTSGAQVGGAPSGGLSGGGQGPGDPQGCVGTLDDVNQVGGAPCPTTLCAANIWARDCEALPDTVVSSALGGCAQTPSLTLQFSGGGAKTCYYDLLFAGSSEPHLMAVAVSGSDSSFCGGTSNQLSTGNVPPVCKNIDSVVCDRTDTAGTGGTGASDAGSVPPAACFNLFSQTCAPCCPDGLDCAGKPDGYPGYMCTPTSNAFCSCACNQEKLNCGC